MSLHTKLLAWCAEMNDLHWRMGRGSIGKVQCGPVIQFQVLTFRQGSVALGPSEKEERLDDPGELARGQVRI